MAWFLLFLAGVFEIAWVIGLKYAAGLPRIWPIVVTILLSFVSFGLLARAAKDLPIGTSYAVWTGIGALGATVLGILLFHESSSPLRLALHRPDRCRRHRLEADGAVAQRVLRREKPVCNGEDIRSCSRLGAYPEARLRSLRLFHLRIAAITRS